MVKVESVIAQNDKTDVFVVGGGPAGLAAAIAARQVGLSVTVADGAGPNVDKACGEGMAPESLAVLQDLGIKFPANAGFRFRGIQFVLADRRAAAQFPQGYGLGIRRTVLHKLLAEKAEQVGVKVLWKSPVTGIGSDGVRLPGATAPARWIIGADGVSSRVRTWSGLGVSALRTQRPATRRHYRLRPWNDYVEIHWGWRAQAYVTPVSDDEVCVVIIGETAGQAKFDSAFRDMPELRARLAGAEVSGRERGAITMMHVLRQVSKGQVALVGDASGGVDAITGEGLRLGFQHALALASALASGDLQSYDRAHQRLAKRPLRIGALMLQMGKSPWLQRRAIRALAEKPELFRKLLCIHVGQSSAKEILATGAQLSWQFLAA
jgi:flavin-dependent dehydrogenase